MELFCLTVWTYTPPKFEGKDTKNDAPAGNVPPASNMASFGYL